MSGLYFRVGADFDNLKRLKKEIEDLKTKLSRMDKAADPKAFNQLNKKLQDTKKEFNSLAEEAAKAGAVISSNLKKMVAGIGSTAALTSFAKEVVNVRGEFQQLEIAFGTMLKSGDKAKALIGDLTDFAARTPFGLQSAASAAKQLIAYGSQADSVIQEMTMLGDVAAGTGQAIGDIVYLYGTLRMQGRAYLMDIRQFAGRGIPIYKELANVLGVAEGEVNNLVSAGKVGFKEVDQAFKNMTSSGGMYGGLMEEQSKAITGQIEALKDNIQVMFNEIGKSSEGVIGKAIESATSMVENYEKIGKTIAEFAVAYGSYKAILISVSALQSLNTKIIRQAVLEKQLAAAASIQLSNAEAIAAARTKMFTIAQASLSKSLKATAASLATNPYAVLTAAVVGLGYGIYKLATYQTEAEKSQKRLSESMKDFNKSTEEEAVNIDILFGRLKNAKEGTEAYQKAKDNIINKYGNYLDGLNEEIRTLKDVEGAYKAISDAAIQSAKDRAIEKGTQSAVDSYTEQWGKNIEKIKKSFVKEFGEAQGTLLLDSLKESLSSGSEFSKEVQDAIDKLNKTAYVSQGMFGGTASYQTNPVEDLIGNIRKSKGTLDNEIKDLESIYGKLSPKEEQKIVEPFVDFDKQLADAKKSVNNLNKELENLRKGIIPIKLNEGEQFDFVKAIEDKTKEYQEAEKRLQMLTGKDKESKKTTNKIDENSASQRLKMEMDLENRVSQVRIDAMNNGLEKSLAQMKLNHAKELQELEQEKESYLRKIRENEKAKFEADPANQGKVFDPTSVTLSEGQEAAFAIIYRRILEKQRAEQALFYKDALTNFQTYQERRSEILRKSAENEKNIIAAGGSGGNLSENKQQTEDALSNLDKEFVEREETFKVWMESISSMTLSQLVETLKQAEIALSHSKMNIATGGQESVDSATLREQVKALREQIKTLQKKEDKNEGQTSIKRWKDTYKVLGQVNKELSDIGDNVGGSVGELISFAGELSTQAMSMVNSITQLSEMSSESIKGTAKGAVNAIQMVERASVILAIISAALQIINKITDAFSGLKDAERDKEEYTRILIDLQDRYNNKLLETMLLHDDVFGTDDIGNMIDAVEALNQATENYNNLLTRQQKAWKDPDSNFFDKAFQYGTIMGWAGMSTQGENKTMKELRDNLRYITKKSSNGVLGIGGNHTKTKDLTEWVKENLGTDLFYEDGRLNLDVAVNLVEGSSDRLAGDTKESLETLIEAEKQIRAAEEAMKDYISNTFGSLGDSAGDSIVEAFSNGTDAAKAFKSDVISVLEDVGKQIVRNLFLQKVIDQYSEALDSAFKKERIGTSEEIANALSTDVLNATTVFFNGFTEASEQANEWLQWFQGEAATQGFDLFKPVQNSSIKDTLDDIVTQANMSFSDIAGSFEDQMSKAIMNVIKKSFLDDALMDWYKNLEDAMNDGTLSEEDVDRLRKEYENAAKTANEKFKAAMDIAGINISDEVSDNSLAGALSKASQESIDLLAGQMGAGRIALERGANAAESIRDILSGGFKIDTAKINAMVADNIQGLFDGKGFEIDTIAIDSLKESLQATREIVNSSFGELTAIRELNSKIEANTVQLNGIADRMAGGIDTIATNSGQLSHLENLERIAGTNDTIANNTKRTVNKLNDRIDVKIKG